MNIIQQHYTGGLCYNHPAIQVVFSKRNHVKSQMKCTACVLGLWACGIIKMTASLWISELPSTTTYALGVCYITFGNY